MQSFLSRNNALVTVSSTVLVFCLLSAFFPETFFKFFSWIEHFFIFRIYWLYTILLFLIIIVAIYLAFGPYKNVRIGGSTDSKPEYGFFTWFSMLFSAGMGTGVMFCGVYEPLYHFMYPPVGEGMTAQSLDLSFFLTFLHWGVTGWALYAVIGFALAYCVFDKKLPLRFSSALYPVFKEKIHGPLGYTIDALVVFCTLFGVATTLARGSLQINSGLAEFFNIPYSNLSQSIIIFIITVLVMISVASGINRGIKYLSQLNVFLCLLLLCFVLFAGPTLFLIEFFMHTTSSYLVSFVKVKDWILPFGDAEWQSQWTILYWAWWISWAPFVGIFIARISKGRTLKEFISGALIVPSLLSFIWFIVFGGTAIHEHINSVMNLTPFLKTEYALIIFKFFEHFPLYPWISYLTLVTILIFFITSSDSASYMISYMTAHNGKPTLSQKLYWSFLEGFIALFFLFLGGVTSLEQMVIITAFPITLLIPFLVYSLFVKLKQNHKVTESS